MNTGAQSNDTIVDLLQVGAMFGLIAGVLAWVLVMAWTLLMQLRDVRPSIRDALVLHLEYLVVYVVIGALVGALWPTRSVLAGRVVVSVLVCALGALTVFSVSSGPVWRWPVGVWGRFAVASILFSLMFTTWGPRRG
jgi:hypothetical protein